MISSRDNTLDINENHSEANISGLDSKTPGMVKGNKTRG